MVKILDTQLGKEIDVNLNKYIVKYDFDIAQKLHYTTRTRNL